MKKNITINLFGSLYAIDEDAYELLNRYESNMRAYFAKQEGGDEIADDIEHRVAELMAEVKASGVEAITIEHVKEIIDRIGRPEEMDGMSQENEDAEHVKLKTDYGKKSRKLFRNPDDKLLGGVISGIAAYLGFDVLWCRIAMLLLAWVSWGTMIFIYLILWALLPEASTAEDFLKMRGEPVNMDNLKDEIIDKTKRTKEFINNPQNQTKARGCIVSMLNVLALLFKGLLILFIVFAILLCGGLAIGLVALLYSITISSLSSFWFLPTEITQFFSETNELGVLAWVNIVAVVVLAGIIIYTLVHCAMLFAGKAKANNKYTNIVLIVMALTSVSVLYLSFVRSALKIESIRRINIERRDSVLMDNQLKYLQNHGWEVVVHKNCDAYVKSGDFYNGNKGVKYIDAHNPDELLEYETQKTVSVTPGVYQLSVAARTDGNGCLVFLNADSVYHYKEIPTCGSEGGDIWEDACNSAANGEVDAGAERIIGANDNKGLGWSRVVIKDIRVKGNKITYGVTTLPKEGFTGWNGTWFSAWEFELKKVGE